MKSWIIAIILLTSNAAFGLEDGLYECRNGNEPSICPQKIKAVLEGKDLVGLRVYYSGYCNDQGPYYYDCDEGLCGDGQIEFSKIEKTTYHWQNLPHGFFCDFVKQ